MATSEKPADYSFMLRQLQELAEAMQGASAPEEPDGQGRAPARQRDADELCFSALSARRARGESYGAIAADLNRRGIRGRYGARWYGASVWSLLHSAQAR